MASAHHNRSNRRSGGARRFKIPATLRTEGRRIPMLTIQCYERRHSDCDRIDRMMNDGTPCECACHGDPHRRSGEAEAYKRGMDDARAIATYGSDRHK